MFSHPTFSASCVVHWVNGSGPCLSLATLVQLSSGPSTQRRVAIVGAEGANEGLLPAVMHPSSHEVAVLSQALPQVCHLQATLVCQPPGSRNPLALAWALLAREQKRDWLGAALILPSGQQMCSECLPGARAGRALDPPKLVVTPFFN